MDVSHLIYPYGNIPEAAGYDYDYYDGLGPLDENNLLFYATWFEKTYDQPIKEISDKRLITFIAALLENKGSKNIFSKIPSEINIDKITKTPDGSYYDPLINDYIKINNHYHYSGIFPIASHSQHKYEMAYLLYSNLHPYYDQELYQLLTDGAKYIHLDEVREINLREMSKHKYVNKEYLICSDDQQLFEAIMLEIPRFRQPISKPTKRKTIPKKVRSDLWKRYFGRTMDGECQICQDTIEFDSSKWHAGHIIPDVEGGTTELDNLAPLCSDCNLSMSKSNAIDWARQYYPKAPLLKKYQNEPDGEVERDVRPKTPENVINQKSPNKVVRPTTPIKQYESHVSPYNSPTKLVEKDGNRDNEPLIYSGSSPYDDEPHVSPQNSPTRFVEKDDEKLIYHDSPSHKHNLSWSDRYDNINRYDEYLADGIGPIDTIDVSDFSLYRLSLFNVVIPIFGDNKQLYQKDDLNKVIPYILGHPDPTIDGIMERFNYSYFDYSSGLISYSFPKFLEISDRKAFWAVYYFFRRRSNYIYDGWLRTQIVNVTGDVMKDYQPTEDERATLLNYIYGPVNKSDAFNDMLATIKVKYYSDYKPTDLNLTFDESLFANPSTARLIYLKGVRDADILLDTVLLTARIDNARRVCQIFLALFPYVKDYYKICDSFLKNNDLASTYNNNDLYVKCFHMCLTKIPVALAVIRYSYTCINYEELVRFVHETSADDIQKYALDIITHNYKIQPPFRFNTYRMVFIQQKLNQVIGLDMPLLDKYKKIKTSYIYLNYGNIALKLTYAAILENNGDVIANVEKYIDSIDVYANEDKIKIKQDIISTLTSP